MRRVLFIYIYSYLSLSSDPLTASGRPLRLRSNGGPPPGPSATSETFCWERPELRLRRDRLRPFEIKWSDIGNPLTFCLSNADNINPLYGIIGRFTIERLTCLPWLLRYSFFFIEQRRRVGTKRHKKKGLKNKTKKLRDASKWRRLRVNSGAMKSLLVGGNRPRVQATRLVHDSRMVCYPTTANHAWPFFFLFFLRVGTLAHCGIAIENKEEDFFFCASANWNHFCRDVNRIPSARIQTQTFLAFFSSVRKK